MPIKRRNIYIVGYLITEFSGNTAANLISSSTDNVLQYLITY